MSGYQLIDSTGKTPPYKVGGVFLRGLQTDDPQVLIVRPRPKNEGELPDLVLPRGSRQYKDMHEDGHYEWCDVRDAQGARIHAATLEPLHRTLEREMWEEAGMPKTVLHRQETYEFGEMDYQSRTKGSYPIYWFAAIVDEDGQGRMRTLNLPDALETRWVSIADLEGLAEQGIFSPGYVPIVSRIVNDIYYGRAQPFDWKVLPEAKPQRSR